MYSTDVGSARLSVLWRKLLLLAIVLLSVSFQPFGQNITLTETRAPLQKILDRIKDQSRYSFFFSDVELIKKAKPVTVTVKNVSLKEALDKVFEGQPLTYEFFDKIIAVKELKKQEMQPGKRDTALELSGKVIDEDYQPVQGATIQVVNGLTVMSREDGSFRLLIREAAAIIKVSYVGHLPVEVRPWKESNKIIRLLPAVRNMEDVVVKTGMFDRNRQTFTGAVASFSGKELRQVGNLNLVQSLKTLDPSFIIVADNLRGSDPNLMPKIEIRGKTSISTTGAVRDQFTNDPNQPLFILNGMETTLQQILDIDINRIASVTILKDAASTALYGSRAANGVVVVETIRPKPGKLNLSYNNSMRFEMPDLSDYNMMNATENLEFQRLAGLYEDPLKWFDIYMDNLYNQRLIAVKSGINSYWLNVPLRNSVTHSHSLHVSGGSQEFQFNIGLSYRQLNGVMKGSDRSTPGGSIDLIYRKGKLNISNQLMVNGYVSNGSPYGSFASYVNINPYYNKRLEDGRLNTNRYLETYLLGRTNFVPDTIRVGNPLYNATLNSMSRTRNLNIQNNLSTIWDLSENWRASGGLQVQKASVTQIFFSPPANTQFDQVDFYRKGSYTERRREESSYQANAMITYKKVFAKWHSVTGNMRGEIQEQKFTSTSFGAEGFPEGVGPNPAFSFGYEQNKTPSYQASTVRRVNGLASMNYSFQNRYYADFNFRVDGSTSFGSENKYSPFWSVGLGWTISGERFLQDIGWLNMLRIRANIGTTGNQALGSYASSSVYGYENNLNIFGQGLYLTQLGNPSLEWQNTRSISMGADAVLFDSRLNITVNAYQKISSPLITKGSVPASTGVSQFVFNIGELRTEGVEANLRFSPVRNTKKNIVLTFGYTGSIYRSEYRGFSNLLKNLNDEAQASNSLQRFLDGYSPDELWAVTSKGIDPASGREVFVRKSGESSFIFNPEDMVPQGEGRPTVEGVISSNLNLKGFLFGVNLRYSLGARIFNAALYNKVENISIDDLRYNQDKRALELRWKKPGDQAQFRAINITESTPLSSRFIQEENYLIGESINAGYDFTATQYKWVRKAGLKSVRLNGYMNDIFRMSNIRSERGIDYPFSYSFSFSINLFF